VQQHLSSDSVTASTATFADVLSIALCLASPEEARAIIRRFGAHALPTFRDAPHLEL
jgi:hypothetical protein